MSETYELIGGPLDGQTREVEPVLPFLDGGIMPKAILFGGNKWGYTLDHETRKGTYVVVRDGVMRQAVEVDGGAS